MRQLFFAILGFCLGLAVNRLAAPQTGVEHVVRVDTIRVARPVPRDTVVLRYVTVTKTDTVMAVTQVHYADTAYEAWVSGIEPRLDSLRLLRPVTAITLPAPPPRRWHLGVTAGMGLTPRGAEPYVGIGITYSILSF